MMRRLSLLNVILTVGLVVLATLLYLREHETRGAEREIRRMEAEIAREKESIRILEVEWAMLTNPVRIERLARQHLKLAVVPSARVVPLGTVLQQLPQRRYVPHEMEGDPLAALIARLQSGGGGAKK